MVSLTTHSPPLDSCSAWLDSLTRSRPTADLELVRQACLRAETLYGSQRRPSGETYLEHVLSVATILAGLRLDVQTLAAALLHDVPTVAAGSDLAGFGAGVVGLVDGVQRMDQVLKLGGGPGRGDNSEGLRKLLLSIEKDVRSLLIRLAERTHDMRTAKHLPDPEIRRALSRETMDIYAPLANRLGMGKLKWELEDLSFRCLEPETYQSIATKLDEKRLDRESYLEQVMADLRQRLTTSGLRNEVTGRPKHIYSIWRKMLRKEVDFERIYDVRAVRVLVDTVADCYTALGVVHGLWSPLSGEFDDYIAKPKNNLYQSLHTAVVGPEGKVVEVQIRSHDMHRHAELGVAAHWRYKEGGRGDTDVDLRIQWLRQLLALEEQADPTEFMERFKQALHYDTVHVFTPKGQVIDLPRGATPLDFAYHVHTEVGHRCRGAKVNGRIVSLTSSLQNGDRVEILTAKQGGPSRDWLNPTSGYLRTSRAKDKVRQWFRLEHYEENIEQGRATLERELGRQELSRAEQEMLIQRLGQTRLEDVLAALGRGDLSTVQLSNALAQLFAQRRKAVAPPSPPQSDSRARTNRSGTEVPRRIRIQGVGNLVTHLAQCCQASPGDPIIGYVTQNQGISVHRADCPNVLGVSEENRHRLLEAQWSVTDTDTWLARVQILARDRAGLLRDVTGLVTEEGMNMVAVDTKTDKTTQVADMRLTMEVGHDDQLARLVARMAELRGVMDIRRLKLGDMLTTGAR